MKQQALTTQQESCRRIVVRLIYVLFWMLIFEGAVRKWVAPQYSSYLYFMRDPVCLVVYFYALRGRLFSPVHPLLIVGLCMAGIACALSLVNLVAGSSQYTPLLAAYGVRNYFFYLPLAFLIDRAFGYEEIRRLAMFSMIAICIATPIALLQFEASPDSILNTGSATDPDFQFKNLASGSGKVRPAGTFTSVMGMTQLSVSTVALLMWAWLSSRKPKPVNPWLVRIALMAVAASIAVSGSRTAFVHSCLVIAAGVGIGMFLPGAATKTRTLVLPLLAVVVFALLFPLVFPEAFTTFVDRWNDAAATEGNRFQLGWIGRALYAFYDFFRLFNQVPVIGYGIGTAGNGAVNMGVEFHGMSVLKLAEEDWSRHVIELGPVLALMFILFRISFGVWLGLRAIRSAMASRDPLPVLLFAFCGVALVQGQITGHGLVNGFGWLYVGACMASCSALLVADQQSVASTPHLDERLAGTAPFPNLMR